MGTCLIWDTPARVHDVGGGDFARIDSPRAGGKYKVTGSVIEKVRSLPTDVKKGLTSWLLDQRRAGIAIPEVCSYTLDELESRPLMSFVERMQAALLYVGSRITKIGDYVEVADEAPSEEAYELAAVAECEDIDELYELLRLMTSTGYLDHPSVEDPTCFAPTP